MTDYQVGSNLIYNALSIPNYVTDRFEFVKGLLVNDDYVCEPNVLVFHYDQYNLINDVIDVLQQHNITVDIEDTLYEHYLVTVGNFDT